MGRSVEGYSCFVPFLTIGKEMKDIDFFHPKQNAEKFLEKNMRIYICLRLRSEGKGVDGPTKK